jgi:gliding motility-associated-like protein
VLFVKNIESNSVRLILIMVLILAAPVFGKAQLDTKHYIPPMFGKEDYGTHYLVLGTPVTSTFNVTVSDGAGNLIASIPLSSSSSSTTQIGDQLSSPFLVNEAQLNSAISNGKGLILSAPEPFYASVRVTVSAQAGSLTSKGEKAALGKDFRTAHMFNNNGYKEGKSNVFSIMATENNTTINISDINPGVIFRNTSSSGTPLTSNNIALTLNEGESYVIAAFLDEANATNNMNGVNGTHITSDKNIVVNCGSWLGGNAIDGVSPNGSAIQGRDIGIDQIVPIDNIGDEYVIIKGFGVDNERTIVVASEDNTQLYLNGSSSAITTIDAGEYYVIEGTEFSSVNNLYLKASKAVYVTQTLNGGDGNSDDNERQAGINFLPPVVCTGAKEVTIPNAAFIGTAYINIIADAGANVLVNGNSIGSGYSVPGNPDYVTYQLSGYAGDVTITSDKLIRVALLNLNGNIGAAGYFSGFSKDINLSASYLNNAQSTNEEISESCGMATITIERSSLNADVVETINISVQGSATEGVDYSLIPDQVTFAVGQTSISFQIEAFEDNFVEGDETVFIELTIAGDACGADELEFTIKDIQELEVILDDSNILCPGDDVTLVAVVSGGTEPYSYSWSNNTNAASITVTPNVTATYTVTVTDACQEDTLVTSAIVEVPIYELIIFSSPDTAVLCPYSDMVIAAEATGGLAVYDYQWYVNGVYVLNGPMMAVSPAESTEYIVQITDQCGLASSDTIAIDVITPLMVPTVPTDIRACPFDTSDIWVTITGGLPPFEYYWPHSAETTNLVTVYPGWTTSYTVVVQDACATYEIEAHPQVTVVKPIADFSVLSSSQMENLPLFYANNSTGGVSWWWDLGNGETSTQFAPGTTYSEDGIYTVTLIATNDIGCTDTAIKEIRIKPEFYFYAPNAFTPNGDSYNNFYSVSVIGAQEFTFYVYNRWGEQIYFTDDVNFQWDGTFHDILVSDGVYIYKSRVFGEDGEVRTFNGHISVLK